MNGGSNTWFHSDSTIDLIAPSSSIESAHAAQDIEIRLYQTTWTPPDAPGPRSHLHALAIKRGTGFPHIAKVIRHRSTRAVGVYYHIVWVIKWNHWTRCLHAAINLQPTSRSIVLLKISRVLHFEEISTAADSRYINYRRMKVQLRKSLLLGVAHFQSQSFQKSLRLVLRWPELVAMALNLKTARI